MQMPANHVRFDRNRSRPAHRRCLGVFVAAVLLIYTNCVAAQEYIPAEDQVVRLTLPINGQPVTGVITSYTHLLFTLQAEDGRQHRLLWNQIPADRVDRYWRYLQEPEGDAAALFELGDILIRHSEGWQLAEQAFEQALALDPSLAEAIARSRQGLSPDGTPRYVGTADPQMWGELSDETMQAGTEFLHAYCGQVQETLSLNLNVYESDRFILLTDVDPQEVNALATKLMQAYHVTAEMLGDDPRENVFVGKCLIVLFNNRVDYIRYQLVMHETDARGTGGMCHAYGNGHAHVAAYRRADPRQTNHIVVHEFVHAYLHRYRTPLPLDDWVNEGLAVYLSHVIEPPPGVNLYLGARLLLEGETGVGPDFFTDENLDASRYQTAGALTRFLLERSQPAYPQLIQSLKAGNPTDQALTETYRMDSSVLTRRFRQRLDRELTEQFGRE